MILSYYILYYRKFNNAVINTMNRDRHDETLQRETEVITENSGYNEKPGLRWKMDVTMKNGGYDAKCGS